MERKMHSFGIVLIVTKVQFDMENAETRSQAASHSASEAPTTQ
jgi:hypothetical protein